MHSPMEAICMTVFHRRQKARYLEALLPLAVNLESAEKKKLLDNYFKEMFPHSEAQTWKTNSMIQEALQRELDKGPMLVKATTP